jgi:hypothetical protein
MKRSIVALICGFFMMLCTSEAVFAQGDYSFEYSLYKTGMRHQDVKVIQQALKQNGTFKFYKTTTYYGCITEKAVRDFQKKHYLLVDGIAGKQTLGKMRELKLIQSNSKNTNVSPNVSRGQNRTKYGEALSWWTEVKDKQVKIGDVLRVQDFKTGQQFFVQVTYGTNHADVEAVTKKDTEIMKKVWGGFSWERRSVLVYNGSKVIAASMTNMPHAGVDWAPEGKTVSGRSGGYGTGYNLDKVKGNGMNGVVDLHFKNSTRHMDNKVDSKHQKEIRAAAGLL